ncbi:MAG: SLC13 family permease [Thermomicrobiales bacterium]|nr:SLC13 family permease [Thermomicrobiales bacterium]MCO5225273.1 SLC13 family permease [Thermomicrobiales bacterium]
MDQVIAFAGLVLIFVLAFWRKLPMGAVALSFAYFMGTQYFDFTPQQISSGFPAHLIVTLIGVTYLFGIGHVNGTVDQIVASLVAMVRGRVVWIPWVFFVLAMGITASGALSVATLSILIPIGMGFAIKNKINPILMGLSIINGTNAGGFSPVAVYYLIISGVLEQQGVTLNPIPIFILTFVCSLLINVIAFFLFGGYSLVGKTAEETFKEVDDSASPQAWQREQILTILTMLGVMTATILFDQDVGYMAITGAIILAAFRPDQAQEGLKRIGWGIVLLIGGMVTYINVLNSAGIITDIAERVAAFSMPLLAALVLIFISSFITAFASSNAMFVIVAPLAAPLLLGGEIGVTGFFVALAVSVVASDACPISTAGALVTANVPEHLQQRVFGTLFRWGMTVVVVVPLVTWLIFVVGFR